VISPDNSYSGYVKWPNKQLDWVTKVATTPATAAGIIDAVAASQLEGNSMSHNRFAINLQSFSNQFATA
jgi:hypothetical protein